MVPLVDDLFGAGTAGRDTLFPRLVDELRDEASGHNHIRRTAREMVRARTAADEAIAEPSAATTGDHNSGEGGEQTMEMECRMAGERPTLAELRRPH